MKVTTIFLVAAALLVAGPTGLAGGPDGPRLPHAVAAEKKVEPAKAPADWGALFKMHWQNRVAMFKAENLQFQNVVLLGDSITEGFEVPKYFPGRRILNRGIGADVIGNNMPADDPRGVLQRLDNSVFDCAATDLFVLIGINDLNSGRSLDSMEEGYRELLKRIRAKRPDLRIVVQSLLPTRGAYAQQNGPVVQFNERLKKLAPQYGCSFLDLHSLMRDAEGQLKAEFTGDGLHLTELAYRVWRRQVLTTLNWNDN
jgi:lysophospholipase L1-like esterase